MTDQPTKRLYTRSEAAAYIAASLRDLDRSIAKGEILALKRGRKTLIDVAELDRFIERLPSLVPGRLA